MTNPPPRDRAVRKVVAAARAIVTYHAGIPVGAQRLSSALSTLADFESVDRGPIESYMKSVADLSLGSERLEASRAALDRFDIRLEAANQKFRDAIFAYCFDLLERFGAEVGPTPEVETRSTHRRRDA
jgi:hypothetical protein